MKKLNFSFKSLDPVFERIEKITKIQRVLIYVGAFVILVAPIVYFSYLPKFRKIEELESRLDTLKTQLVAAKRQASQLASWRKKHKAAQETFAIAKKALPQTKEIPTLLATISASGQESGLDFILFKPLSEKQKNFYAEIPVSIHVSGAYHNVATFYDKVSRLSRLVNIDNINITTPKSGDKLSTSCLAITYRFVEPKAKKPAGKKAKKK